MIFLVRPELTIPTGIAILPAPVVKQADLMRWADEVGKELGWEQNPRVRLAQEIWGAVDAAEPPLRIWELYKQLDDIVKELQTDANTVVRRLSA